jgi:hypothetical protein
MGKLLGANWRTSASGLLTVTAAVISTQPTLIAFLPHSVQVWVQGIAGLVAAISGAYFALMAKDRQVTGGVVQQTADGSVASRVSHESSTAIGDTDAATPNAWAGTGN